MGSGVGDCRHHWPGTCRDRFASKAIDEGVVIAADKYGKVKTVMQIIAIIPLLLHYPLLGVNVHLIGNFLLYIALVLTIFSGLNYFYKFYGIWRENDRAA